MPSDKKIDLKHFGIATRIVVALFVGAFALIYQFGSEHTFREYACIGLLCGALWLITTSILAYIYRFKAGLADEGIGMCVGVILLSTGGIAFIYVMFTILLGSLLMGSGFPPFKI